MRDNPRLLILFLLICSLAALFGREGTAEFVGRAPTGVLELEKKHPYYLFVPPDYVPERTWPLLVLLPKRGGDPKQEIRLWMDWAKQNQFLVLALPSVFPDDGLPQESDRWLLEVKEEVGQRYRINAGQVLLGGIGTGAHYAAYLGLRYPDQFSAALLIGKAWPGPLERLSKPSSDERRQIPFYVALNPEEEGFSRAEEKALDLEGKGYRITFDPLKPEESFTKLQERVAIWFRQDYEIRTLKEGGFRPGWRGKARAFVDKFLEV